MRKDHVHEDATASARGGSRSRDILLAAASDLLDERDPSDISVTDIVNVAGVTRPTFYQAFGDLPTIFAAAAMARLRVAFVAVRHDLKPGEEIADAMHEAFATVLNTVLDHGAFFLRVFHGPGGDRVVAAFTNFLAQRISADTPIADALETSPLPASTTSHALSAGLIWMLIDWLQADDRCDVPTIARQMREYLTRCVIGGLATPGPSAVLRLASQHSP
ncbi:TetR/AcrR family transcriptional regulator [Pseudoclavibacter sp. 13-3]|uniref:TetR/AcrR family transcriptional regulator n=1 Tax=Pseudoclavibacter sp. 13-3 TaxID=2901228 RepID=UPI001E414706|nr:TetR/AcrR family transcriptional regulator [Pseudoclavibacter sp. 13-3]MCD7100697.1 TetR/AcrR family transcriptional regulator [Pseudoclavibacter sp. 13-3]